MSALRSLRNITLIVLILVIALLWALQKCSPAKQADVVVVPAPVDSIPSEWVNMHNETVASLKALEEQFTYATDALIDSIARLNQTKNKQIKELLIINQKLSASLKPVPGTGTLQIGNDAWDIDTAEWRAGWKKADPAATPIRMRRTFRDSFYTADVLIGTDTSYMNLTGRQALSIVWKEVKEGGLFNRKKFLQVDVTSTNPNITTTSIQAYRKMIVPKEYAVVAEGQILYTGGTFYPILTGGIQREQGRFTTSLNLGKAITPVNTLDWFGSARVGFKLIRF